MAWAVNRQPYNRSAHTRGYAGGRLWLDGTLGGGSALGGNVHGDGLLQAALDGSAGLSTKVPERRPLLPAPNRHPLNRSALLRTYAGGQQRLAGGLESTAAAGGEIHAAAEVTGDLDGAARLALLVLERHPRAWAPNRQPFNRSARRSGYAAITMHLAGILKGDARSAAEAYDVHRLGAGLHGSGGMAQGMEIHMPLAADLLGSIQVITGVNAGGELAAALGGRGCLGADIHDNRWLAGRLRGTARLGGDIYVAGGAAAQLAGLAHAGANIYSTHGLYEVLVGYANARNIDELVTTITGAIPPGATLVIDAENYAVTLDNVDVIHWHGGAWLDVGRGTVAFTLSGVGSDSYHWEVFYIARYL